MANKDYLLNTLHKLSCYLIGETGLLIRCSEILQAKGFKIRGIISPSSMLAEWTAQHNITYFNSLTAAKESLLTTEFDFLFSIINTVIIPENILRLPKKLAINYHDSLLPHYAGSHATSWAIINNEVTHGVSWHIMSSEIDAGAILKQDEIVIEKQEIAATLNLKCFEKAIILFSELVNELCSSNLQSLEQNLYNRTYYPVNKKPKFNGLISWNATADYINSLVRALDFWRYQNYFSAPKFLLGQSAFIIKRVRLTTSNSEQTPGTIIDIRSNKWCIATGTKNIELLEVKDIFGKAYGLKALSDKFSLKKGDLLKTPALSICKKYENISIENHRYEPFWLKELSNFTPFRLSNILTDRESSITVKEMSVLEEVIFPDNLLQALPTEYSLQKDHSFFILTVLLSYLKTLNNSFDIELSTPANLTYSIELQNLLSIQLPFCIKSSKSFSELYSQVYKKYQIIEGHGLFLKDIYARHADISELHSSIGVIVLENQNIDNLLIETPCALIIKDKGKRISWLIKANSLTDTKELQKNIDAVSKQVIITANTLNNR